MVMTSRGRSFTHFEFWAFSDAECSRSKIGHRGEIVGDREYSVSQVSNLYSLTYAALSLINIIMFMLWGFFPLVLLWASHSP